MKFVMPYNVVVILLLLLTVHVFSNKFNLKKPALLNHDTPGRLQNQEQKRTTTGNEGTKKNVVPRRENINDRPRESSLIKKSVVGRPTENEDKGFVIVVDADEHTSQLAKRDQVNDAKNSSLSDDEISKDIYDQLKTRFERIEQHLESFSKQSEKAEPQVRVVVITPKALNVTQDKNLSLVDLENAAASNKDNLFVKEITTKEFDDTFANALKRKTNYSLEKEDPEVVKPEEKNDHETKEIKEIEPLLADKDTLNEVVREIDLLRNYSRNDNSSGFEEGEKNQATTILDDVMAMAKGEAEHRGHEIGFQDANQIITEASSKYITSLEHKEEPSKKINDKDGTPHNIEHHHKQSVLPPSNPAPKFSSLNLPNHHETDDEHEVTRKHENTRMRPTKTINKDNKSPMEQIAKGFGQIFGVRRNSSKDSTTNGTSSEQEPLKKIIDKEKAEAIIEFLNKDPLEVWRYPFKNLHSLALNSTLLRAGLVNAGNIERLKGVMRRALEGKSVTISIVGGSISAGGGLYKDEKSITGLYYKGLIDWWQKMITPLTGSDMIVNNVAIGSIGTDYFSYCVKNHIANGSDIVLWELAANDYNRYKMQPTKGARPLERFTRMVLELPNKPALIYINFFKGIDFKATRESCPDFEDQGEDIIAHYYRIPSLSWRAMVCNGLVNKVPGYGMNALFSQDEYHPSIRGHAQMSLLILLHLRHVMRAVLQWAIGHDGVIERFEEFFTIPEPLFMGPRYPEPLCWSLISPDLSQKLTNSLHVQVKINDGFKLEYATNFPIRYDKVVCWKAEKPHAEIGLQFYIPEDYGPTGLKRDISEVAITTHTRWGGSASLWFDDKVDRTIVIKEGREHDPGKRTQVDSLVNDLKSGYHILHIKAHEGGFCLSAIMVDSS